MDTPLKPAQKAYINGYIYDIFISYAHLDNAKLTGQAIGWIEQLYTDLNLLITRRIGIPDAIKIWWDNRKLDGTKVFDQSIEEGINQSAIMLCLISPTYLASPYCRKELELFHRKARQEATGLQVGDRSRIINVLMNNIPYSQWPKELSGTTGFPFHDATDKEDFGDPLDVTDPQFKNKLKDLRDAIVKLIGEFPKATAPDPAPETAVEKPEEEKFTIYFGDVADSLRTTRKRSIIELEKKGFRVVSDVPPPYEAVAHEKLVREKSEEAGLCVHLLDQLTGREIEGDEAMGYPQKQAEISLRHGKSQLIWTPADLEVVNIEDENYRLFMEGIQAGQHQAKNLEFIRGSKSTVTQQIIDLAEQLKLQQKQKAAGDKISVLLDTHYNDQMYALELGKTLLENQIQPFINPQEDDPRKNINLLSERISQVSKLVFFYGKVTRDWVLERMSAALQLIITNDYAVEEFFVLMVPPHKNPGDIVLKQRFLKIIVMDNSNAIKLDPGLFERLIKDLKDQA